MAKKKSVKTKKENETLDPVLFLSEDNLVCPYCKFPHDPDGLYLKSHGNFKCLDCGEEFEYERIKRISYSTW